MFTPRHPGACYTLAPGGSTRVPARRPSVSAAPRPAAVILAEIVAFAKREMGAGIRPPGPRCRDAMRPPGSQALRAACAPPGRPSPADRCPSDATSRPGCRARERLSSRPGRGRQPSVRFPPGRREVPWERRRGLAAVEQVFQRAAGLAVLHVEAGGPFRGPLPGIGRLCRRLLRLPRASGIAPAGGRWRRPSSQGLAGGLEGAKSVAFGGEVRHNAAAPQKSARTGAGPGAAGPRGGVTAAGVACRGRHRDHRRLPEAQPHCQAGAPEDLGAKA
jgi:hypothetical protein